MRKKNHQRQRWYRTTGQQDITHSSTHLRMHHQPSRQGCNKPVSTRKPHVFVYKGRYGATQACFTITTTLSTVSARLPHLRAAEG